MKHKFIYFLQYAFILLIMLIWFSALMAIYYYGNWKTAAAFIVWVIAHALLKKLGGK